MRSSCIVTADTLITEWEPQSFAELETAHLEALLVLSPELVLLGTGPTQQFPPGEMRALLAARRASERAILAVYSRAVVALRDWLALVAQPPAAPPQQQREGFWK